MKGRWLEMTNDLDALILVGVLLAGDFYTNPDLKRRGSAGDLEDLWIGFDERFRWVAGVASNHDLFAGKSEIGKVF